MPAPVRIRIGAGLDASVEQAFGAYEKRAARAAENAQRALNKRGRTPREKTVQSGAAKATADAEIQQARRSATVREKINKDSSRAALAEIRRQSRERAREHRQLLQEVEREERKASRERERRERADARRRKQIEREARRDIDRFATRTSHRTTRFLAPNMPLASVARRGAMDLARGMGVETNFAGLMSRVVEADKMARQLSVKGYIEGEKGAAGTKQDPNVLREQARALGEEMGMATEEILRGQEAFVDLRGNLAGARDIAKDMAKLARSQGADYRDVMYMAGKAEAMFAGQAEYAGDELKKRQAISSLLRTAVYEAKKYSIPLAEMAKEFPKLAGIASQFEGDAGKNAVLLMGTAQLAEAGAAKNPATAGTYAQNLALSLTKQSGKFESVAGINVFSDKERNKLKDIGQIITETLVATEKSKTVNVRGRGRVEMNQLQQLQEIMPNKRAFLALQKYQEIFTEAGGGQKGADAVNRTLKDLAKGIKESQIDKDLATVLGGTEAKAQKFNQQLEKIVSSMADNLLPTLEEATPVVLKLVDSFGQLVGWLARNPGLAVTGAITASIARAGLESTLRTGIESAIKGVANNKTISITGKLAAGATIAATAVTIAIAGMGAIDWGFDALDKAVGKHEVEKARRATEFGTAERIQREKGGITEKRKEGLEKIAAAQIGRIVATEGFNEQYAGPMKIGGKPVAMNVPEQLAYSSGKLLYDLGRNALGFEGGRSIEQISKAGVEAADIAAMKAELAQMNAKLQNLHVYVDNASEIGAKTSEGEVDPKGRE